MNRSELFKSDLLFSLNKAVWEILPDKVKRTENNREIVRKSIDRLIDCLDYD